MRPGRGLLSLSPPKGREGDGENDRGGVRKRGGRILHLQRKVGKLGNLGRTIRYFHRSTLVKNRRVKNLGVVTYEKFFERVRLHITTPSKEKEE